MRKLAGLVSLLSLFLVAAPLSANAQGYVVDVTQTIESGNFVGAMHVYYNTATGKGTVEIIGTTGDHDVSVVATLSRGRAGITVAGIVDITDGTITLSEECVVTGRNLPEAIDEFVDCILEHVAGVP